MENIQHRSMCLEILLLLECVLSDVTPRRSSNVWWFIASCISKLQFCIVIKRIDKREAYNKKKTKGSVPCLLSLWAEEGDCGRNYDENDDSDQD